MSNANEAEFHELEPLHEPEALESSSPSGEPPTKAPAGQPEASSGPRDVEQAPLMLQKAAMVLFLAALFPWLSPLEGWDLMRLIAKVVILIGGWFAYCGIEHLHGHKTPLDALGKSHKMLLPGIAAVVMLVGVFPVIDSGAKQIVEKAAVAIGILAWAQVHGYSRGGKFNPTWALIIPLFGLAGLINIAVTFIAADLEMVNRLSAVVGSLGVAGAGALAGYTLYVSMKEAKAHGEAKKRAASEARMEERRRKRTAPGDDGKA